MEILVCVRRVPDTSENEIELNTARNDIERDDLVYSVNEPDNYAVEEALQIVTKTGGNVTVVTVGGEDDEEILRREMAMGAQSWRADFRRGFRGVGRQGYCDDLEIVRSKESIRPDLDWCAGRGRRGPGGWNAGGHARLSVRFSGDGY